MFVVFLCFQSVSAIHTSAQYEVCILMWSDFTLTENKIPLTIKSSQSKHYSDLLVPYYLHLEILIIWLSIHYM